MSIDTRTQQSVGPETAEKLVRAGTSTVANVLLRHGFSNVVMNDVQPLTREQKPVVGPAFTLRFIPSREDIDSMATYGSDENLHRRAIEECPVGAVLVIDAFGCDRASAMGDVMAMRLNWRGVAGVVTDGGFRDASAIARTGLSTFQRRNATPATPIAMHPAALQDAVGCGGVAVYPGDVVFGDADAVVVIPAGLADQVADEADEVAAYEEYVAERVARGSSIFGLFPATPESKRDFERQRENIDLKEN